MMWRSVAEETLNPPCSASHREETGSPRSMYSRTSTAKRRRDRSDTTPAGD